MEDATTDVISGIYSRHTGWPHILFKVDKKWGHLKKFQQRCATIDIFNVIMMAIGGQKETAKKELIRQNWGVENFDLVIDRFEYSYNEMEERVPNLKEKAKMIADYINLITDIEDQS